MPFESSFLLRGLNAKRKRKSANKINEGHIETTLVYSIKHEAKLTVKVQLACHVHPMEGGLCLDFKILVFAQVTFSVLPDANWQSGSFLRYVACMLTGCHAQ